jgi:hypothetical protein
MLRFSVGRLLESRRQFLLRSSRLAAWYGVLQLGFQHRAWARTVAWKVEHWSQELARLASDVRAGRLAPQAWQHAMEQLHSAITISELIESLDVDQILRRIKYPSEKLGAIQDIRLSALEPKEMEGFGRKLFVYRKGSCTPPHAHNHLVSAHLILRGQIRTRKFNRLEDVEHAIVIEPTVDGVFGPGHTDSMSDDENNVHWFQGVSDIAVTFDVPVWDISPEKKYGHPAKGQIFIDPTVPAGGDGRIVAPVISFPTAVRKFA